MPDFHPLIVHFPIALLTLYSLFEIVSIRKLQEKPYWFYVKAVFVIFGALGAIAMVITGQFATYFVRGEALAVMHQQFALASAILSTIIAIMYALAWFGDPRNLPMLGKFLFNRGVMIPLAIAGLIIIFITGGLHGAITFGTDFDPLMKPIFELLNL
ncbi:MAG: hypothetical protein Q8O98_01235 [bacterium]|nr:hypothetical protein [bacterium]